MATEYGSRLRKARKHAGLTQVALSEKTGIPQSTISTAEREGSGSAETPVYADACGVSALWLGTGFGDMIPAPVTQATAPASPGDLVTPGAMEIAFLYDEIPVSNRIKRTQAWNAATEAILKILQSDPASVEPMKRPKKQHA